MIIFLLDCISKAVKMCLLLFWCCLAVDGWLLRREGVIWTKWLEGLLLKLEQSHIMVDLAALN
jgi:hypothetical protein